VTSGYSNLNDRSPSWLLRLARHLLPGAGLAENEIKPYAEAWHQRNLEALAWAGRGLRYRIVNLSFSGARVDDVLDRQIPALAGLAVAPSSRCGDCGSPGLVE
jgi:hypothetical protein